MLASGMLLMALATGVDTDMATESGSLPIFVANRLSSSNRASSSGEPASAARFRLSDTFRSSGCACMTLEATGSASSSKSVVWPATTPRSAHVVPPAMGPAVTFDRVVHHVLPATVSEVTGVVPIRTAAGDASASGVPSKKSTWSMVSAQICG